MTIAPKAEQDRMRAYLESFTGVPVEWGKSDCCMFMAGWLSLNGARLVLPEYASERDGLRLIRAGLVEVLDGVAARSGIDRTDDPQFGDVGVVETATGPKGAIWLHGGYVALRTDDSYLWLQPVKVLASWKNPCAA